MLLRLFEEIGQFYASVFASTAIQKLQTEFQSIVENEFLLNNKHHLNSVLTHHCDGITLGPKKMLPRHTTVYLILAHHVDLDARTSCLPLKEKQSPPCRAA
jgi:hypothetical protein